jgi:hypothetical protein
MLRWRSKSNKRLADSVVGSHVHNHHTAQDTLQRYISQLLDHKNIHIHMATWPYFLRETTIGMSWHSIIVIHVVLSCVELR